MPFDIKSIAIIGAGPSGLASLYEILHTAKDGTSHVGGEIPQEGAFERVVAFESKSNPGGIWAIQDERDDKADFNHFKDLVRDVNEPGAENHKDSVESDREHDKHVSWNGSTLYENLFTNIPQKLTRFSSSKFEERNRDELIHPFLRDYQFRENLKAFVNSYSLDRYIRYNTEVVKAKKIDGKWKLTIKSNRGESKEATQDFDEFDALIVANGHQAVPFIPKIEGISEYEKLWPNSITHSKYIRKFDDYVKKKVLVIGSSISGIAIAQYLKPITEEFLVSRKRKSERLGWINNVINSNVLDTKPLVKRFNPSNRSIEFEDGSSVKDFDSIILATGYLYSYPFLEESPKVAESTVRYIKELYYNIFSINDPTLGFVGVIETQQLFTAIETQAAALAGVWSNAKKLPESQKQREWEASRIGNVSHASEFFVYSSEDLKENYIDKLQELFPTGRPYPIDKDYSRHTGELERGDKILEDLFFSLVNKQTVLKDRQYVKLEAKTT